MPKISVIIPCYNQGQYIDEAVASVLNQTFQDFEIIIINDGSTDPLTRSKLSDYQMPYTRVIQTENMGVSASRNMGVRFSNGTFIQFLDADDLISPEKFEMQLRQLISSERNSLSYTDYQTSEENDINQIVVSRYVNPAFQTNDYLQELIVNWEISLSIPIHCFLFAANIFKEHRINFDEELENHEDSDCWMNIFSLHPEVYYVDKKLVTYRIRKDSNCSNQKLLQRGYLQALRKQCMLHRKNKVINSLLLKKLREVKYFIPVSSFIHNLLNNANE